MGVQKLLVYVAILVVAYILHSYLKYLKKSALLYLKTKGDVDVDKLLTMEHTDSVYKILYNVDTHITDEALRNDRKKWNHILFAHCIPSDQARHKYIDSVKKLQFVQEVDVVVLVPWYFPAHIIFNAFIRTWRLIGRFLGKLPPRPLDPSTTPLFKCTESMERDGYEVVVFNLFNITDTKVFGTYAKEMFTVIYPTVGANIYFTGDPDGDNWNEMNIMKYESHRSWCEAVQSNIFYENHRVKQKCTADPYTYVAKQLHGGKDTPKQKKRGNK